MWSKARKNLSVLTVTSILCVMLAACGDGGGGTASTATVGQTGGDQPTTAPVGATETTAPVGEETVAATPAGEATQPAGGGDMALPEGCSNVELSYWNPFTGPDGPFMGQMVEAFNGDNANVKVTMTTQADYYTQIQTAAASDTLPDVAIIHADQVATWAFRNVLRPIDEVVTATGLSEGDYPEAVWAMGEVAGKRYSIPLDIHPMTMFYNADLLTAAGINEPPTNSEEFEAAAQAVTDKGQKGFMLTAGFPIQQIFSMLLYQNGGSWFNEDGTKATWNSDAGVRALTWLKDAQTKWSEPNLEVDAELAAFKAGGAGMIWNGIWQTTNVTGEGVSFKGEAAPVPQLGTTPATWAGSHQFTLPVHKAGADECKDAAAGMFIKYMVDNSVTWAQAGQIPANNDVRESAEFKALPQAVLAESAEAAFFPAVVPGITDAFQYLDTAVGTVMSGAETDIKKALDDAAAQADQKLAENKETFGDAPSGTP
ncbi:MAG TPA: ABC transporter substrate-binding protein [Chloroflexia bacterium]|jgi:multiple sugar transport system substrate-binding protein